MGQSSLNARIFGVHGDGSNETAKLQNAVNTVGERNGGVVWLSSGVYDIRNVALPSNVTLCGDGIGKTIIRPTVGGPGARVGEATLLAVLGAVASSRVRIEGITIDLFTNQIHTNGIALIPGVDYRGREYAGSPCSDCDVEKCEVLGADFHEYMIWSMRGQRINILECRVDGNFTDFGRLVTFTHGTDTLNIVGHGRETGYGPVSLRNVDGALPAGLLTDYPYYWINTGIDSGKLALSQAEALAGSAISFADNGTGTHTLLTRQQQEGIEVFGGIDVHVKTNTIRRIGRAAINVGAAVDAADTECIGLVIEGNIIESSRVGVSVGPAWDAVNGAQNIDDALVTSNIIRDTYDRAIVVATTTPGTTITNITVEGNSVNGAAVGLEFYGLEGETHKGVIFRDNAIANVTSTQLGAVSLRFADDVIVEDNHIVDCARGVYCSGSDNVRLSDNEFDGIQLETVLADDCVDLEVRENRMIRYSLAGTRHCLTMTNLSRGWVIGNRFKGTSPGNVHEINIAGDQVIDFGNRPAIGGATFNNASTNRNHSTVAVAAGLTTIHIPNTLAQAGSRIHSIQVAGTPITSSIVAAYDASPEPGIRLSWTGNSVGNEQIRWEIHF